MAVTKTSRWDDTGSQPPANEAKYTAGEQPVAEYDNWFNYAVTQDLQAIIDAMLYKDGSVSADKLIISDGAGHYLQVPQLTTTERDNLTAVKGMVIYNSTTDQFEIYEGTAWKTMGVSALSGLTIDADKDWQGKKITNLGAPTSSTDAARKQEVDDHANQTSAHSATASATANRIILRDASGRAKVAAPSASDDIARKAEVDAKIGNVVEDTTPQLGGDLDAQSTYKITNLAAPTASNDAARKAEVDAKIGTITVTQRSWDTVYQNTTGYPVLVIAHNSVDNPTTGSENKIYGRTSGTPTLIAYARHIQDTTPWTTICTYVDNNEYYKASRTLGNGTDNAEDYVVEISFGG